MTSTKRRTWRLRLMIIASGVALGFLAKWVAGHYSNPPENKPPAGSNPKLNYVQLQPLSPGPLDLPLEEFPGRAPVL
jgi:hypothetical protein